MRETWAFLAGLLENGGWIGTKGGQPAIEVSGERDVVNKLLTKLGVGSVYGPDRRGGRVVFLWAVQDREEVMWILQTVKPWLGRTRAQEADLVLREIYASGARD